MVSFRNELGAYSHGVFVCDGPCCGKTVRADNSVVLDSWFLVHNRGFRFQLTKALPFSAGCSSEDKHACSYQCAARLLAEFVDSCSIPKQPATDAPPKWQLVRTGVTTDAYIVSKGSDAQLGLMAVRMIALQLESIRDRSGFLYSISPNPFWIEADLWKNISAEPLPRSREEIRDLIEKAFGYSSRFTGEKSNPYWHLCAGIIRMGHWILGQIESDKLFE